MIPVETARDQTQDWILPPERKPRSFAELEGRIDDAVAVARSAEAAALAIGDTAIQAAEQARRAAHMAEAAALRAGGTTTNLPPPLDDDFPSGGTPTASASAVAERRFNPPTPLPPGEEDDGDHDFAPPRPSMAVSPRPVMSTPRPAAPAARPASSVPRPAALTSRAVATSLPDLDERLRRFIDRAGQVSTRLIALGRPDPAAPATGAPLATPSG